MIKITAGGSIPIHRRHHDGGRDRGERGGKGAGMGKGGSALVVRGIDAPDYVATRSLQCCPR